MTASAVQSSSTTHQNTKTRRVLRIEEAQRWCVRDELPKSRNDDGLFTKVDNWNRELGIPLALGDPSPDALVFEGELPPLLGQEIKRADAGLGQQPLDLSPYEIGHGLGPSVRVDPIIAKVRRDVVERIITLVRREAVPWLPTCAVKGGRPDHGGPAECEGVKGTRGQVAQWLTVSAQAGTGPNGEPWFISTDQ